MNKYNFEFEIWVDGKSNYVSLRGTALDSSIKLNRIWFFMNEEDLKQFEENQFNLTLTDITHRMNIIGDMLTFYDMEMPNKDHGVMEIPFSRVEMPVMLRKIMGRIIRKTWKGLRAEYNDDTKYHQPRVILSFTPDQVKKFLSKYGQAKGSVEIIVTDSELAPRFEEHKKDKNFVKQIDNLIRIAKNSTWAQYQKAKLFIYKDGDSYGWAARNSHDKTIMHGGLIDHGREEGKHDWSTHT